MPKEQMTWLACDFRYSPLDPAINNATIAGTEDFNMTLPSGPGPSR